MNLDSFVRDTANCLEFVAKTKHVAFIQFRLKTLKSAEDRDKAEARLMNYLQTEDKSVLVRPHTVCFTLHGIRTDGTWQTDLKRLLDREYENIECYPLRFGFIDAISFLIPFRSSKPVNHIRSQLQRDFKSKVTNETVTVCVAHSYGTYVIYKILQSTTDIKFNRIILSGSVLKRDVSWGNIEDTSIISDCGTEDIFPSLARMFSFRYGAAGLTGFDDTQLTSRYHRFGHGGFFTEEHMLKFWLPYIADGVDVDSELNAKTPYILNILGIFPGMGFILISLGLLGYYLSS